MASPLVVGASSYYGLWQSHRVYPSRCGDSSFYHCNQWNRSELVESAWELVERPNADL